MSYTEYTVKLYHYGDIEWYMNGKFHREDGPAVECANGDRYWYINDKYHREDGPAIEFSNGSGKWYLNGKLHREDGPAIEFSNGDRYWYLEGVEYTEEEWEAKVSAYTCTGKTVTIDGVEYELHPKE